jgi:hypothetical protein
MMMNDPYIEIINKTKSLNIDEKAVEGAIDWYMENGADKAFSFLIHDQKIPESEAWKLMEAIKKEFKASYFASALYAGVFMVLFLSFSLILIWETGPDNTWIYISTLIFSYCAYAMIRSLVKALRIKLNRS